MVRIGEIAEKLLAKIETKAPEAKGESYEKLTKGLSGDNSMGNEGLEVQYKSASTGVQETEAAPKKDKTDYNYDKEGTLISTVTKNEAGQIIKTVKYNKDAQYTKEYEYDKDGKVSKVKNTDSNGVVTEAAYKRDDRGRITKETVRSSDGKELNYTYKYDENGRVIETTVKGKEDGAPVDKHEKYEYDNNGKVKTITDKDGNKTIYNYDANGEIKSVTTLDKNGKKVNEEQVTNPEEQMVMIPEHNILKPYEPDPNN